MYVLYAVYFFFFFFNDTATTEIYTLSLHDALPISRESALTRSMSTWSMTATSPGRSRLVRFLVRRSSRTVPVTPGAASGARPRRREPMRMACTLPPRLGAAGLRHATATYQLRTVSDTTETPTPPARTAHGP